MYMVLYDGEKKTLFMILFSLIFIFPFLSLFLILVVMWLKKENMKRYKNKDNIPFRHISFLSAFATIFLFHSLLFSRPCVYRFVDINHLWTCQQRQSILSQCLKSITICSFKCFLIFLPQQSIYPQNFTYFLLFLLGSFVNDVWGLRVGLKLTHWH